MRKHCKSGKKTLHTAAYIYSSGPYRSGLPYEGGKSSGTKVELPAHRLHGGTFMSAKNPVLRDSHEYILIFSKESFTRGIKEK